MLRRLVVLAPVIAACHGGAEARSPEGVARLTLTADDTSLAVNESTALRVTVYDERANVLYSSDGGPVADSVSFAVEPPGVIAVESAIALAVGRGHATVKATFGATSDSLQFVVEGMLHGSDVTANETWRAADSPHFVRSLIRVGAARPVTLTLEPGAEARFGLGAGLVCDREGAVLTAAGTPDAPISLIADATQTTPYEPLRGLWSGVLLTDSRSDLRHVTMSGCGRAVSIAANTFGACLVLSRMFADSARPLLQSVTIRDYGYAGVHAQGGAGFAPGSQKLVVTNGGPAVLGGGGLPILITANEVATIPPDTAFTRNLDNRIHVGELTNVSTVVASTQTWRNFGAPYVLHGRLLVFGDGSPLLTLEPGVELQFGSGTGLHVGQHGPGGVIASGTAGAPVVFTCPGTQKLPLSWDGLVFGSSLAAGSRLDHAIVEAGGGARGFGPSGEVLVEVNGLDSLITNSVVRGSATCGIVRDWMPGTVNTDYTAPALNNAFAGNNGGDQCGP